MKNWLSPDEIYLFQPQTPEQVDEVADDIHKLASLLPQYESDFLAGGMREFPEAFTLAYHNDEPVGYIEINNAESHDLGKDSLEFGGSVLPEYRDKGLTLLVAPTVIREAFKRTGKSKMLANIPKNNQEAKHAIVALGFRFYGDKDGLSRYKLDRTDALA
jgi:RimJ/RimL family protein N-acetyltransferase